MRVARKCRAKRVWHRWRASPVQLTCCSAIRALRVPGDTGREKGMSSRTAQSLREELIERAKVGEAQHRAAQSRTLEDRCRRFQRLEKYFPVLAEAMGTWPEFQGAEILNLSCPPHPHQLQRLPTGESCGTCVNFRHCLRLEYATADQNHCDFMPSRYREGEQP